MIYTKTIQKSSFNSHVFWDTLYYQQQEGLFTPPHVLQVLQVVGRFVYTTLCTPGTQGSTKVWFHYPLYSRYSRQQEGFFTLSSVLQVLQIVGRFVYTTLCTPGNPGSRKVCLHYTLYSRYYQQWGDLLKYPLYINIKLIICN